MSQLTLDGREIPLGKIALGVSGSVLSPAQSAILRAIGEHGSIRSVEAGLIVHRARHGGIGCYGSGPTERRLDCCGYAATDGLAALKRLEARGFVRSTWLRGRWVSAS